MEVSGISLQKLPAVPAAGVRTISKNCHSGRSVRVGARSPLSNGVIRGRFKDMKVWSNGFADNNHVEYYNYGAMCGAKKEKEREKVSIKKKLKLLKGLSKNLSMFSGMGLGMESETGLTGEIQGKMISEASELLLKQLEKLRAEEKELKKKKKLEKNKMKAMRMSTMIVSSSSSSSESECGEVSMNTLRSKEPIMQTKLPEHNLQVDSSTTTTTIPTGLAKQEVFTIEEKGMDDFSSSVWKSKEINGESGAVISGIKGANTVAMNGANTNGMNGANTNGMIGANTNGMNGANTNGMNGANTNGMNGANTSGMNGANTSGMNGANTSGMNGANTSSMNGANTSSMNGANTSCMNGANTSCMNGANTSCMNGVSTNCGNMCSSSGIVSSPSKGKIEVCMGGKCKKSGGAALLSEFQRIMGVDRAVGCKCMGKCKQGPNVKVIDSVCDDMESGNSVRTTLSNSLFLGVGLEDVGDIMAKFLGDDQTLSLAS